MKRIVSLFFPLAAVLACGGATLDPLDDGGTDSSPANDAGSYCPSSPPAQNAACSKNGLWCEYGNNPSITCNTTAQCANGSWIVTVGADCFTPPNSSACAATFDSVPVGQSCGNLAGTFCSYEKGQCGCTVPNGPVPEDASAAAKWFCDEPAAGCPMPRPRLGTACTSEGLECDYSPCVLPTGASLVCQGGAWENQPYGCAL
jgi:hypothetical protein